MLGQQAGELLTEDPARTVHRATEEPSSAEAKNDRTALEGQVVGRARIVAVDLTRRLGAQGAGYGRGSGPEAKGDDVRGDLDLIEAEPWIR